MGKFKATSFLVKRAKESFNSRYDLYRTVNSRYMVFDNELETTKLSAGDMDFEKNLFQLAFTYIKDKIPTLLDSMVGFEVADKNEEGTSALGLFMFDIRGRKFYIPVSYSNGELQGADLLYDLSADRFIPNKDNWVDYLLTQSPSESGFAATDEEEDIEFSDPDMNELTQVDAGKFSAIRNRMSELSEEAGWGDLPTFLKNSSAVFAHKFAATLKGSPELHKACLAYHGSDIYDALETPKFAAAPDLPELEDEDVKVQVYTSVNESGLSEILKEDEVQSLVENGVAFVDNRGEDETAVPYTLEVTHEVHTPSEPGVYRILFKGGQFKEMVVLPKTGPTGSTFAADSWNTSYPTNENRSFLLVDESDNTAVSAPSGDVLARRTDEDKSLIDHISKLPSVSDMKPAKQDAEYSDDIDQYILVDDEGTRSYGPVSVETKMTNGNVTTMSITSTGASIDDVVISDKYSGVTCRNRCLYVSPDTKMFKVSQPKYSQGKRLDLGTHEDLDNFLKKDYEEVKVSCVGFDEYHVYTPSTTVPYCTAKAALQTLVLKANLKSSTARDMLAISQKEGKATGLFKNAAPGEMLYPGIQDPAGMSGNSSLGVTMQTPGATSLPAMSAGSQDVQAQNIQDAISGMNQSASPLDSGSVEEILQAAETGEREVFDTSAIANLIDSSDIDALILRFSKDLNVALDRLGRLQFLMMIHKKKFLDRFGGDDTAELEDSINSVFKNLGELVLKLKERKITSDSGYAVETDLNEMI